MQNELISYLYTITDSCNNSWNCFHSLRHTFASWLAQKGTSIYEIQKLLGHSDIKTTQIYAHLLPNELHKTVGQLEGMVPTY